MSEETLKNKTIKGVGWSAADTFLGHGVSFLVGLVLARLLSPSEYGLIGICLIFTSVLNGMVDSGFSNALIRKKDVSNVDYNTMFITNMMFSIILYVLLFSVSPFISNFFAHNDLAILLRVMGIIVIINALSITQTTVLTKRLDFKSKTKASLLSALFSGIIGIAMAYMNYGVWALVAQQLSNRFLYTLCLWIYNKWWPNTSFSKDSFLYMWGFGWKLMVSGLLNNIWNQLYQVVVGKCYSPSTLGQYTRSRAYADLFSSNITVVVQRVSYPVLADIQNDIYRMTAAYRRVIKITMFVTSVCMVWLGAVAGPLIYCLIGSQWNEAATYLPLICISMSLYPLHAINLNMLQVQGRSDIFLYLEIIKKILALIPICIGIFVDIYWMLIATIFIGIIAFFLNSYYSGRDFGYSSWMQLKDVMPDYGISLIIGLSVYFFVFLPLSYWIILAIQIIIGFIVFIIINEVFNLEEYNEVKSIIRLFVRKTMTKNK